MYQTRIFLKDLSSVKHFAAMTAKYDTLKINLISDIYTIDAHSVIGIMSLDISSPLTLEIPDEDPPAELMEDLKPFLSGDAAPQE